MRQLVLTVSPGKNGQLIPERGAVFSVVQNFAEIFGAVFLCQTDLIEHVLVGVWSLKKRQVRPKVSVLLNPEIAMKASLSARIIPSVSVINTPSATALSSAWLMRNKASGVWLVIVGMVAVFP